MNKHAREQYARICKENGDVKGARRYEEGLYNSLGDIDMNVLDNLVEEVQQLRKENESTKRSYELAVKQLENTRLWIAKYEGTLKEMANQAGFVKCSAQNIDEWIKDVRI